MDRRKFVRSVSGTVGAISLATLPMDVFAGNSDEAKNALTIREVIDLIVKAAPGAPFADTVDTVKSGNPDQVVTGIVTTMFATIDVIRKAITAGANLIIAHEPTFYNHLDDTSNLKDNDTYLFKEALLEKNNIVVWRCHDYIHEFKADGVYEGVLAKLGWKNYADPDNPARIKLPKTNLQSVIALSKKNLGIGMLRYMGEPLSSISSVALMVGAAGGSRQIAAINQLKPDLVMIGELVEWETMEYLRDLRATGAKTSLIILGHIPSEEPGMEWLGTWLKPQVGPVTVKFIPSGAPVKWA
ncbi:MAG: NGG1p interacting factor NIF3 [Chitinophagaceae bacterium]|nr:MAG: NGG1p interacting factor NIF3 [Chitinophagaceae bacterium]